jgi:hypothetical protein
MDKELKNEINKEKNNKKLLFKKIIIIIIILIVGFIVISSLPFLYFVVVILYSMFIDMPAPPKVKHGEFPFELVYEYKGERRTIEDVIVCDYEGISWSLEGGNSRDWNCDFQKDNEYGQYIIDNINERDLYIEVPEAADYYMGDKGFTKEDARPLLMYIDEVTGTYYQETDKIDEVGIKIIEWQPSEPLKGNFK